MRLALYQSTSPAGDIPAGLSTLTRALKDAAAGSADVLVMPELFLPGYNSDMSAKPDGWDGALAQLAALCADHSVALCIGLPEFTNDATYNSSYFFDDKGQELARYRKIQLWGDRENDLFHAGDQLACVDYKDHRFGLMICYDVEFPEHTRALARAGATIILCPTANMTPYMNVNLITVPARAAETGLTIVYANYTGTEGDLTYTGHSQIAGPDGYPLAATGTGEGSLIADVPNDLLENGIPFSTQLSDYTQAKPPKIGP